MRTQLVHPILLFLAATVLPAAVAPYASWRCSGRGAILLVFFLLAMSEWALAHAL